MNAHARRLRASTAPAPRHGAGSHVAMGVALAAGAVIAAGLIAHHNERAEVIDQYDPEYAEMVEPAAFKPRRALFGMIWPPLMMALTLSGLRVWNAPPSPERTKALTLWSLVQGFNTVWMAAGPKRLGGQVTASVASLVTSAAYALSARKVDAQATNLAGPYIGWIGLANVLTEQLWRRPRA